MVVSLQAQEVAICLGTRLEWKKLLVSAILIAPDAKLAHLSYFQRKPMVIAYGWNC